MKRRSRHYREEPEINFIPLIDVLLVILIFLMVTTTYSRHAELQISLPDAQQAQEAQRVDQIDVAVDAKSQFAVNGKIVPEGELTRQIQQSAKSMRDPLVAISADAKAPHQAVIRVMEAAQAAGYAKITFATQQLAGK